MWHLFRFKPGYIIAALRAFWESVATIFYHNFATLWLNTKCIVFQARSAVIWKWNLFRFKPGYDIAALRAFWESGATIFYHNFATMWLNTKCIVFQAHSAVILVAMRTRNVFEAHSAVIMVETNAQNVFEAHSAAIMVETNARNVFQARSAVIWKWNYSGSNRDILLRRYAPFGNPGPRFSTKISPRCG